MITLKKSTDEFVISWHGNTLTLEWAIKELDKALMRGDSRLTRIVRVDGDKLTIKRRVKRGLGPTLTWIFEGPKKEINKLIASCKDEKK